MATILEDERRPSSMNAINPHATTRSVIRDDSRPADARQRLAGPVVALAIFTAVAFLALVSLFIYGPDRSHLELFGHAFEMKNMGRKLALLLSTPLVILPGVMAAEAICVGWNRSSFRSLFFDRHDSSRSDIVMFVLERSPIWWFLKVLMTFGIAYASTDFIHGLLIRYLDINPSLAWMPVPLIFLSLLVFHTFLNYWSHRMEHMRVFWPHHRFHHAAEDFTVLTGDRFHPGDIPTLVLTGFLFAVLYVPPEIAFVYASLASVVRYLIHSRIDSDWGWFGRYVVLSPAHHRAHHVFNLADGGGNYGLVPLWDYVFGTLSHPVGADTRIGIDTHYRHGWWVVPDMLRDSVEMLKGLRIREKLRVDRGYRSQTEADSLPK